MHTFLLLGCVVFATSKYFLGSALMMTDDRLSTNMLTVSNGLTQSSGVSSQPPVVIVELAKPGKKKKTKKVKKNKISRRRPPPPAGCVPLLGSCKTAGNVCCNFCAFCHCRIFRTVCYCRMGNPRC
ncbi:agouti signaling protein 1 [Dunckerocampus dactyliophorus]|uniref:agouti signaling protein 1 n=1 Tax=Dunckerocampus dactyliophorus TaxID=161453 RepID=UPI0024063AC6|nr:agouti signaling protein 1 [Dunckerocampus dactyliophorus]XP_054641892.1 agouti signaling protein 1 [Dunckerocampus dactyliophorus]